MNISALTQTQAAALLSIAPRTLRDWHDAPRNADATYSGPSLVAYYVKKMAGGGEFDDQRQRLAAAQAERVEHENSVRRGDLADMRDVSRFWEECMANMRAKLLALPSKLSPRLVNIGDAGVINAALRADVHACLSELADYEPTEREPADVVVEDEAGAAAPAKPDRKRVGGSRKKAVKRKRS